MEPVLAAPMFLEPGEPALIEPDRMVPVVMLALGLLPVVIVVPFPMEPAPAFALPIWVPVPIFLFVIFVEPEVPIIWACPIMGKPTARIAARIKAKQTDFVQFLDSIVLSCFLVEDWG